ncbi:MAG: Extracellular solute-binding protein [Candidatus Wolfebacteria bacterium GW2011_GWC1_43_10]|uniref:Extracellular solute-binding protein n=2 Tax=Candidatus Wolfeibacteriota TaxID=1752735 RepID=A0A0G1F7F5_9BACT|nr:MAG: Extracellular solute-binding protein [Candidatus Wolfebacteria bacterium GW2011_GWC1_43_10]KKT23170.1 MAG: Extracellular solute-binding protein [Parcubacteria group bacterium GW2011_GWB1_43_8b]OGM89284.1 MAG: hypothetical protein A2108_00215 [Candidatus Wolfebacteria bacterium GWA1_42_9]
MIKSLILAIKSLSFREKLIFIAALVLFVVSFITLLIQVINRETIQSPDGGGSFVEGVVGQPAFINPVLVKPGTVDEDLVVLIFANVLDLSESIKHSKDFKNWTVRLKENARWQDETPLTSDDLIFTVQTIQNPDTLSPLFSDWQYIKISRISEREISFDLPSSYSLFENLLEKLRPIPKKIFADIAPANIKLSSYNLEPFANGPFTYDQMEKKKDGFITAYYLKANTVYRSIGSLPYLKKFTVRFFENEEGLVGAYNLGTIDGFLATDHSLLSQTSINSSVEKIPTTKYYALFLNPDANLFLGSLKIRRALQLAVNVPLIISQEFEGYAFQEAGPIPPILSSYSSEVEENTRYDPEQAKSLIAADGWTRNPETNLWEKSEKNKKYELIVAIKIPDTPLLTKVAQQIQKDWEEIGVKTEITRYDAPAISDEVIKTRDYQVLLFGNIVSREPDLFSFWHSSEKFYPGLNLALYDNSSVDDLIIASRKIAVDDSRREGVLAQIQREVVEDAPAIFLASPQYFYIHKTSRPGVIINLISLPSDRFQKITQWYVKTKRVLK